MSNNEKQEINVSEKKMISIYEVFFALLNKWYIIVVCAVICGLAAFLYSSFCIPPTYSSNAKLYIKNKGTDSLSTSDISISNVLAKDFLEIIQDKSVLQIVSSEMDNKYSAGQIKSFLSATVIENTRFIELTVTSPNAEDSKTIINKICIISQEKTVEITEVDRIVIVREGDVGVKNASPVSKNTLIGILIGMLIPCMVILIILFSNDTLDTQEDVEKIIKVNVLAAVPYFSNK